MTSPSTGPLSGVRVIEVGGIGPGPFCAMLLADLGADVLRIDRIGEGPPIGPASDHRLELVRRGRRSAAVNLKHPDGPAVIHELVSRADALIEGYRPGVAERLGIGPDVCLAHNPRLVYGRMTGWGQEGPLAQTAGHDLNYIARSGVLGMIGRKDQPPTPPLNAIGDGGGGGMLLALGILAALIERGNSGRGQVIDAAMVDGSALLAISYFGYAGIGGWSPERGTNFADSGSPFYDSYETADDKWLAVAALEPQFFAALLSLLGLEDEAPVDQNDPADWPRLKARFTEVFRTRTRDEWCRRVETLDACIAPVLAFDELEADPHLRTRQTFVRRDGMLQPAPGPRFSRTPAQLGAPPPHPGEHTGDALADWGLDPDRISELEANGAIATRDTSGAAP